jgi:hypothetical protein
MVPPSSRGRLVVKSAEHRALRTEDRGLRHPRIGHRPGGLRSSRRREPSSARPTMRRLEHCTAPRSLSLPAAAQAVACRIKPWEAAMGATLSTPCGQSCGRGVVRPPCCAPGAPGRSTPPICPRLSATARRGTSDSDRPVTLADLGHSVPASISAYGLNGASAIIRSSAISSPRPAHTGTRDLTHPARPPPQPCAPAPRPAAPSRAPVQ